MCAPVYVQAQVNVLFINPSIKFEPFWHKAEEVTKAAADDLDLHLDIIYGGGNRLLQLAELKAYLKRNPKPDYVIFMNYPSGAKAIMDLLELAQVQFITIEDNIFATEREKVGKPGDKYQFWLGEIFYDHQKAGQLLAQYLLSKKRERATVIGLSGHHGEESLARNQGLIDAAATQNASLAQVVYASWSKELAYQHTLSLLKRYPDIGVIWTASDLMAQGALQAIQEQGLKPNQEVFIGGFDWLDENLNKINKNQLAASVGGHFMMPAWALISIYDHAKGVKFWSQQKNKQLLFDLELITEANLASYINLLQQVNWLQYDFKAFSLLHHPQLTNYQFNLAYMFSHLKTPAKPEQTHPH